MKILYDYQAFNLETHGGVSKSFCELIKNKPDDLKYELSILESDNIHLRESFIVDNIKNASHSVDTFLFGIRFPGKRTIYNFIGRRSWFLTSERINLHYSIEKLKEQNYDIFHPTFFNDYFLNFIGNKPFVLTVHDLIPERQPNYFSKNYYQILQRKKLLYKANHIIAVSENTKNDIIDLYGIEPDKISVIYHGFPDDIQNIIDKPIFSFEYVLYVGKRSKYKNFEIFLKEMSFFLKENKKLHLVCTGEKFSIFEKILIKQLGINNQIHHYYASTSDLYNLYKYAKVFIYPSLYEGFGMPILEAFAMGCPVMLNDTSCFPEIGKDAAIYFKMDKDNNFKKVFYDFLKLDTYELISYKNKGYARLADFSWGQSSKKLYEIYGKLI